MKTTCIFFIITILGFITSCTENEIIRYYSDSEPPERNNTTLLKNEISNPNKSTERMFKAIYQGTTEQLKEVIFLDENHLETERYSFLYSETGLISAWNHYDANGLLIESKQFIYDSNSHLTEDATYNEQNIIVSRGYYQEDQSYKNISFSFQGKKLVIRYFSVEGRLLKAKYLNNEGIIYRLFNYYYNEKGQMTKTEQIYLDGELLKEYLYSDGIHLNSIAQYDLNSNLINLTMYYENGKKSSFTKFYANGIVLSQTLLNEQGNIISVSNFDDAGRPQDSTAFKNGNKTEQSVFSRLNIPLYSINYYLDASNIPRFEMEFANNKNFNCRFTPDSKNPDRIEFLDQSGNVLSEMKLIYHAQSSAGEERVLERVDYFNDQKIMIIQLFYNQNQLAQKKRFYANGKLSHILYYTRDGILNKIEQFDINGSLTGYILISMGQDGSQIVKYFNSKGIEINH